ncbi:hypothetical protein IGI49_002554 [Enterococcus sp. AZ071]
MLVHQLYNDIAKNNNSQFGEILNVLQKVFIKLDNISNVNDESPLINRLVNYLYFTAYTNKLTFNEKQEGLIRDLCKIGRYAGLNGIYRGDYGDITQF